jgi:hypothetical protein
VDLFDPLHIGALNNLEAFNKIIAFFPTASTVASLLPIPALFFCLVEPSDE